MIYKTAIYYRLLKMTKKRSYKFNNIDFITHLYYKICIKTIVILDTFNRELPYK